MSIYGTIYKITNMMNNKVYVGKTTQGFKKRYHGETIMHVYKYVSNKKLKDDIIKYGVYAFKIEHEIDVACSQNELEERLEYYKILYDSVENGYNNNYTATGFKTGKNHFLAKPVRVLNTMKVYETISHASNKTGILSQNIHACCNGFQKTAGIDKNGERMIWIYEDAFKSMTKEEIEKYKLSRKSEKYLYCLNDGRRILRQEVPDIYSISKNNLDSHLAGYISGCATKSGEKLCFVTEEKYLEMNNKAKKEMLAQAQLGKNFRSRMIIHMETKHVFLTRVQLSEMLGISRPTLNEWIKKGIFMELEKYEQKYGVIEDIHSHIIYAIEDIGLYKKPRKKKES